MPSEHQESPAYIEAMKRIDEIFQTAEKGTPLGDELEQLLEFTYTYEQEHFFQ